MLKRKLREMEKTVLEWDPAEIKTEIKELCAIIQQKSDNQSTKFFPDLTHVLLKVSVWAKEDRNHFFDFLKKLCLAFERDRETRKVLEPIADMLLRLEVDPTLLARMRKHERKGHEILSLWGNDILRVIEILKEAEIAWSEKECFDFAKYANAKDAQKFWLLKNLANGQIKEKTRDVMAFLMQLGLGIRECLIAYDRNQTSRFSQLLEDMTSNMKDVNFSTLSLALNKIVGTTDIPSRPRLNSV